MIKRRLFYLTSVLLVAFWVTGCGIVSSTVESVTGLAGLNETGTVLANTAQIRSSYAVVAADLLEVKRGATLDILEEIDFEKVHWYRVRARDEDKTEGWIEAQNVITGEVLEKSKNLAAENKDVPAQATGQLRAASNLRLSPEQKEDNILFKLENGAYFDIVDWQYVPKVQDAPDVDDTSKGEQKQSKGRTRNAEIEAAKEANEPNKLEDAYDIWYRIRLDPSVSPAPGGWLFGRQVELQVPSDIVFYQNNSRKFVAWQRLDNAETSDKNSARDTGIKVTKPGNWVILSRSNYVKAKDGVEPDFDGIIVLGYDKYREEHYQSYRSGNVWGVLPLAIGGTGDNKVFTVQLRNTDGQMEDKRFVTSKDSTGRLKIIEPAGVAKEKDEK
jgi:hypothetical protein